MPSVSHRSKSSSPPLKGCELCERNVLLESQLVKYWAEKEELAEQVTNLKRGLEEKADVVQCLAQKAELERQLSDQKEMTNYLVKNLQKANEATTKERDEYKEKLEKIESENKEKLEKTGSQYKPNIEGQFKALEAVHNILSRDHAKLVKDHENCKSSKDVTEYMFGQLVRTVKIIGEVLSAAQKARFLESESSASSAHRHGAQGPFLAKGVLNPILSEDFSAMLEEDCNEVIANLNKIVSPAAAIAEVCKPERGKSSSARLKVSTAPKPLAVVKKQSVDLDMDPSENPAVDIQSDSIKIEQTEAEGETVEAEKFRVMYIGGLTRRTTDDMLLKYFSKWGEVTKHRVGIKQFRAYGFVTFARASMVDECIAKRPHYIDGKSVMVQRAMPEEDLLTQPEFVYPSTKLYVFGLQNVHTKDVLTAYFNKEFGKVIRIDDRKRSSAFVVFEDYDAVDKAFLQKHHVINGVRCTVQKCAQKPNAANQMGRDRSFRSNQSRGGSATQFHGRELDSSAWSPYKRHSDVGHYSGDKSFDWTDEGAADYPRREVGASRYEFNSGESWHSSTSRYDRRGQWDSMNEMPTANAPRRHLPLPNPHERYDSRNQWY